MASDRDLVAFIRALLKEGEATVGGAAALAGELALLARAGVRDIEGDICPPNSLTASWLRRALLDRAAPRASRKKSRRVPAAAHLNRNESPLSRLISADSDFLSSHHVEAGERVRWLVERAHLQQRVTMSYSPLPVSQGYSGSAGDVSDMAIDARRRVSEIYGMLPRDCAGAVVDICGFLKGLHQVESERGWPRRSAKIVLRIGLDQLAQHYGMGEVAIGRARSGSQGWMDNLARPAVVE
jgi:hypothetical protein